METLFSGLISFIISLKPEGDKIKRWALMVLIFFIGAFSYYGLSSMKKKSNIDAYLKNSVKIKKVCKNIREDFKADNVSVFHIHNGLVTGDNIHLKRFTLVTYDDKTFVGHQEFVGEQLEPYAEYVLEMKEYGWFFREDLSKDEDPLLRWVGDKVKKKGIVYLPLYINGNINGFCIVSYNDKHKFTVKELQLMSRSVQAIEYIMKESIGL